MKKPDQGQKVRPKRPGEEDTGIDFSGLGIEIPDKNDVEALLAKSNKALNDEEQKLQQEREQVARILGSFCGCG